jgi:AsmA family protein
LEIPRFNVAKVMAGVLAGLVAVVILVLATIALLPSSVWKNLIVRTVTSATGRQAAIDGNVQLHIFTFRPEIIVEGFRLANPSWSASKEMLEVRRLDVVLSLRSLLRFHLIFPRVSVEAPSLVLERDATGRANWDFSGQGNQPAKAGNSAPTHIPVIQQLSISDGKLSAVDQIRKLKFQGQVSVQEKRENASREETALNLRGSGALNGKPFDLKLGGGPLIDVDPSKPYSFDTAVAAADIKLTAHTDIAHPFDLASVRSKFEIKGQDLADIYYLSGLALPNTPPYDIAGTLERDNLKFKISDLRGTLGSSDIAGQLGIDTGLERPKLTAQLTSKQLNFADLAAPLGTQALPQQKAKTLAQPQAIDKGRAAAKQLPTPPVNRAALLLPDADLQVGRVRAMDADVTFDAASIVTAKLPMKKVRFHLLLDNGRISLDPLSFSLPQGIFSGTVAIDAHAPIPQTDIDMKLQHVDLAQFKPQSSSTAPLEGQLLGRIRLHGSGTSVHKAAADADGDITLVVPSGEMREAFAELAGINLSRGLGLLLTKNEKDTALRCGVANFHAGDGDLKATTLVLDTTNVLVTGSGQINLKTEALDLALKGQPKKARLLRLRTPVTVRGSLSHPSIGVDAGKVAAQAGGAVALGALLTPVAALLAFVDGGLAKDANCSALINDAEQGKNLAAASDTQEPR